jgi:hypothetical protein
MTPNNRFQVKDRFLVFSGAVLFSFINYGPIKWIDFQTPDYRRVESVHPGWLLLIIVHACLFTLLAIIWLLEDMKKRGCSRGRRTLIFLAVLLTGTSAFFIYLAFRPKPNLR